MWWLWLACSTPTDESVAPGAPPTEPAPLVERAPVEGLVDLSVLPWEVPPPQKHLSIPDGGVVGSRRTRLDDCGPQLLRLSADGDSVRFEVWPPNDKAPMQGSNCARGAYPLLLPGSLESTRFAYDAQLLVERTVDGAKVVDAYSGQGKHLWQHPLDGALAGASDLGYAWVGGQAIAATGRVDGRLQRVIWDGPTGKVLLEQGQPAE